MYGQGYYGLVNIVKFEIDNGENQIFGCYEFLVHSSLYIKGPLFGAMIKCWVYDDNIAELNLKGRMSLNFPSMSHASVGPYLGNSLLEVFFFGYKDWNVTSLV